MEVQLRLLDEVKAMVTVPVMIVANKSDLVTAEGYTTMSTADGTGVDEVLAALLMHKPIPAKRIPTLRGPDPEAKEPEPEEVIVVEFAKEKEEEDHGAKRGRPKRARKPRTRT
jgi:nucleolar GTP-binding protein